MQNQNGLETRRVWLGHVSGRLADCRCMMTSVVDNLVTSSLLLLLCPKSNRGGRGPAKLCLALQVSNIQNLGHGKTANSGGRCFLNVSDLTTSFGNHQRPCSIYTYHSSSSSEGELSAVHIRLTPMAWKQCLEEVGVPIKEQSVPSIRFPQKPPFQSMACWYLAVLKLL